MVLVTANIKRVVDPDKKETSYFLVDVKNEVAEIEVPKDFIRQLTGEYVYGEDMLNRIDTITAALSGITNSGTIMDQYSYDYRSVLRKFTVKPLEDRSIDARIHGDFDNVQHYEGFHVIKTYRIGKGDNGLVQRIFCPEGSLGYCDANQFKNEFGIDAKEAHRNNIHYWIDDYNVSIKNNKYVIAPESAPIEIKY